MHRAAMGEEPARALEVLVGGLPHVVPELRVLVRHVVVELRVPVDEDAAVLLGQVLRAVHDVEREVHPVLGPEDVRPLLGDELLPGVEIAAADVAPHEVAVVPAERLRGGEAGRVVQRARRRADAAHRGAGDGHARGVDGVRGHRPVDDVHDVVLAHVPVHGVEEPVGRDDDRLEGRQVVARMAILPVAVPIRVVEPEEPHDHLEGASVHPVQGDDERIGAARIEVRRHVDGELGQLSVHGRAVRAPHHALAPRTADVRIALGLERFGERVELARVLVLRRHVSVTASDEVDEALALVRDAVERPVGQGQRLGVVDGALGPGRRGPHGAARVEGEVDRATRRLDVNRPVAVLDLVAADARELDRQLADGSVVDGYVAGVDVEEGRRRRRRPSSRAGP